MYPSNHPTSAASTAASSASFVAPGLTPSELVQRTELVQGLTWEDTFARQWYKDGTPCDIVDKKRQTEVRFVCDQQAHTHTPPTPPAPPNPQQQPPVLAGGPVPSLLSVLEVSTCEYLAVVSVPSLCRHPRFSPALPIVHEIQCVEVAANKKDRKRNAREERRQRLTDKDQQQMHSQDQSLDDMEQFH